MTVTNRVKSLNFKRWRMFVPNNWLLYPRSSLTHIVCCFILFGFHFDGTAIHQCPWRKSTSGMLSFLKWMDSLQLEGSTTKHTIVSNRRIKRHGLGVVLPRCLPVDMSMVALPTRQRCIYWGASAISVPVETHGRVKYSLRKGMSMTPMTCIWKPASLYWQVKLTRSKSRE